MNGNELHDALTYLLLSNLKLQTRDAAGREGNSRLVQLFFALLQVAGIPNVFCDVGANDGSTAVIARYTFPGARVISLEANPHIHQAHVRRLTAEGIESLNLAASSMDGSVQIFVPRTVSRAYLNGEIAPAVIEEAPATGNTSMLKRNEDATYEELVVTAATLDSLLA
jgi:FkbM family methyltransferase